MEIQNTPCISSTESTSISLSIQIYTLKVCFMGPTMVSRWTVVRRSMTSQAWQVAYAILNKLCPRPLCQVSLPDTDE